MSEKKSRMLVIGNSLLFAGIHSLGAMEMSSKFSAARFSKDQVSHDLAVKAIRIYIILSVIWTVGNCLILYSEYGMFGLACALATNLAFALWIILSYISVYRMSVNNNNLKMSRIF